MSNSSDAPSLRESPAPQPVMSHVLRYLCPFCRRGRSTAQAARAHIARCWKNPAAQSCKTCAAYQPAELGHYATGYPGCPEGCDGGHSLADGLLVGCSDWEPRSTGNRKDGSSPKNTESAQPQGDGDV